MKGEDMKKFRALSCFVLALCLVFYAVPRLPFQGFSEMATGFSIIWTSFAMLVIGANLMFVIGKDRTGLDKRRVKTVVPSSKQYPVRPERKKGRISIDI
jgi:hypothetical protein